MPHTSRKRSESGFYHAIVKGDGEQIIFESDKDRVRFLHATETAVQDFDVRLHAYCLMSNHVHFLVEDPRGNLSPFMKQLNERYAMYFSETTGRIGHVFQRPFWSEPVGSNEYFLSALRYIHNNPEVAGICPASDYRWSSYQAHLTESPLVEVAFTRNLLGGVRRFEEFSAAPCNQVLPFPESKLKCHLSYDELLRIAWSTIGRETLNTLKAIPPQERAPLIRALREAGLSVREIARFSGLGRSSVRAALDDR